MDNPICLQAVYCPAHLKTAQLYRMCSKHVNCRHMKLTKSTFSPCGGVMIVQGPNLEVHILLPFDLFTQRTTCPHIYADPTQQVSRHSFERLFEIRNDILDILNPYRYLHQTSRCHYHRFPSICMNKERRTRMRSRDTPVVNCSSSDS